jgi:uncharacterized protein (TIGR02001 family)
LRAGGKRWGRVGRRLASAVAALGLGCAGSNAIADNWGGSLDLTSDYFVRGISRSNDQPALQLSAYYLSSSGFVAGIFASNAQITPNEPRDAELSAFLGYIRPLDADWQGKIIVSNYSYPWNELGSKYNYDEVDVEAVFRGWLNLTVSYSPNFPRYEESEESLVGVSAESAEINIQRPVFHKLSVIGGVGYFYLGGYDSTGYVYWSAGAACEIAPVTLTLSYVDTSAEAKALFYNSAYGGKWAGTILWRF